MLKLSQKPEIKKLAVMALLLWILIYFFAYLGYRQNHIQIWDKDGQEYVIFAENRVYLYYFFRPLSYLDEELTGMRFHIGQHR